MEITEKTKELLLECKKVGYERVTIFIADKKVPCSVGIRKGSTGRCINDNGINEDNNKFNSKTGYTGEYWGADGNEPVPVFGAKSPQSTGRIVCGFPPQRNSKADFLRPEVLFIHNWYISITKIDFY